MSLQSLVSSYNFPYTLGGTDHHFGLKLRKLYRDLGRPWPRKKPIPLREFVRLVKSSLSGGHGQTFFTREKRASLTLSDLLGLWCLVHTRSDYVRMCLLRWLCILASANLCCQNLSVPLQQIGKTLAENLGELQGIVMGSDFTYCSCGFMDDNQTESAVRTQVLDAKHPGIFLHTAEYLQHRAELTTYLTFSEAIRGRRAREIKRLGRPLTPLREVRLPTQLFACDRGSRPRAHSVVTTHQRYQANARINGLYFDPSTRPPVVHEIRKNRSESVPAVNYYRRGRDHVDQPARQLVSEHWAHVQFSKFLRELHAHLSTKYGPLVTGSKAASVIDIDACCPCLNIAPENVALGYQAGQTFIARLMGSTFPFESEEGGDKREPTEAAYNITTASSGSEADDSVISDEDAAVQRQLHDEYVVYRGANHYTLDVLVPSNAKVFSETDFIPTGLRIMHFIGKSDPFQLEPDVLLRLLEDQVPYLDTCFCHHFHRALQRTFGWSCEIVVLYCQVRALWHYYPPSFVSYAPIVRRDLSKYLKVTGNVISIVTEDIERSLKADSPLEWALKHRVLEHRLEALANVDVKNDVAFIEELRACLTLVGRGLDLASQGWVDVMAVNVYETLRLAWNATYELPPLLEWLRSRWRALDRLQPQGRTSLIAVDPTPDPAITCPPQIAPALVHDWLQGALLLLEQTRAPDDLQKNKIRSIGRAAVLMPVSGRDKYVSEYWRRVHPLLKHVIEPNLTNVRDVCAVLPACAGEQLRVYVRLICEQLRAYSAGPPDFCEAYAACVVHSFFRPPPDTIPKLVVHRAFMEWEQFKEFVLYDEGCRLTPQMLAARVDYFVEFFLRCMPWPDYTPEFTDGLLAACRCPAFARALAAELTKLRAAL